MQYVEHVIETCTKINLHEGYLSWVEVMLWTESFSHVKVKNIWEGEMWDFSIEINPLFFCN